MLPLALLLVLSAPVVAAGRGPAVVAAADQGAGSVSAADQGPAFDDDFEEDRGAPSLALAAPMAAKGAIVLEGGWLRSGIRADLGVADWVSVGVHLDSMLLFRGLNAQNGFGAGFRLTPYRGAWRASLELTGGLVVVPAQAGSRTVPVGRAEVNAGLVTDHFGAYVRFQLGVLGAEGSSNWAREAEAGLGLEAPINKRIVAGAEVFSLARSGLLPLLQWRVRVGYAW